MGGFSKNIKLRLDFLKSSFLVLHLFYYTTFLMMLSIILLSMLMILLSTLSVINHLMMITRIGP